MVWMNLFLPSKTYKGGDVFLDDPLTFSSLGVNFNSISCLTCWVCPELGVVTLKNCIAVLGKLTLAMFNVSRSFSYPKLFNFISAGLFRPSVGFSVKIETYFVNILFNSVIATSSWVRLLNKLLLKK